MIIPNLCLNPTKSMSSSSSSSLIRDRSRDSHHRTKKKKKTVHGSAKWKTQAQQHLYSCKLHQALTRVNASPDSPRRSRAVREAADRVLAVAARGRTRWSRAILTSRLKLKLSKRHHKVVALAPTRPRFTLLRLKGITSPPLQRKLRVLGRLVPGCTKQPLPVILQEAIDYIPALQMQVRAMTALAALLLPAPPPT